MSFIAVLPDWGLIHASGPDAETFLHGQLTNDLLSLGPDKAQWSGYCTAKGRMLAGFLVWRDHADGFYLATDRSLLAGLVKRLKMFVLRAKVVIDDVSDRYCALGKWDSGAADSIAMGVQRLGPTATPTTPAQSATWTIVLPPVDGVPRRLIWTGADQVTQTINASGLAISDATAWTRLMVRAGEAWITAATQEAYVPQMINFDAIDGISFKKGCYPGQEIVARAHYRGAVKRRMYLATVDAAAKAGDILYASDLNGQESGSVALAAPAGNQASVSELLAVVQIQSHAAAEIRLGAPDGPLLRFESLPYALPDAA